LPQSLGARRQPLEPCPDAETLAAWVDGALDGARLASMDAHLADCARCQELVAHVVRIQPEAPIPKSWWQGSLRARWLVPVAATAAAIVIWVAVPREEFSRAPQLQTSEEAAAARPAISGQIVEPPANARASSDLDSRQAPAAPPPARELEAEPRLDALKSEAALSEAPLPAGGQARRDEAAAAVGSAPDASEVPPLGRTLGLADAASAQAELRTAETEQGERTAAPAARAAAAPAENARVLQSPVPSAISPVEILSPDSASRWRIGAAGVVEYSATGGATWEATPSGTGADLTAGSSPSRTVCWVVGRGGTVLLTTDGRRWQRVRFPVIADLAGVQAADAQRATVNTADGRRFTTEDGGMSWR